ncbi:hypothetical protein B0H13DRAFT_1855555 [Mycena leptocephala]|nr:hypothetical protein B0H13DRAFT_1855555 [Mycena leptocephala]
MSFPNRVKDMIRKNYKWTCTICFNPLPDEGSHCAHLFDASKAGKEQVTDAVSLGLLDPTGDYQRQTPSNGTIRYFTSGRLVLSPPMPVLEWIADKLGGGNRFGSRMAAPRKLGKATLGAQVDGGRDWNNYGWGQCWDECYFNHRMRMPAVDGTDGHQMQSQAEMNGLWKAPNELRWMPRGLLPFYGINGHQLLSKIESQRSEAWAGFRHSSMSPGLR